MHVHVRCAESLVSEVSGQTVLLYSCVLKRSSEKHSNNLIDRVKRDKSSQLQHGLANRAVISAVSYQLQLVINFKVCHVGQ